MNKKLVSSVLLVCILAIITIVAASCTKVPTKIHEQNSTNVRWEYTSRNGSPSEFMRDANALGQEGWELITVVSGVGGVFKRKLP